MPDVDALVDLRTVPLQTPSLTASVVLPADWWDLDLDPKTRHQSVARLVREQTAPLPDSPEKVRLVGQLTSRLRRLAREAEEGGALLCAAMTDVDDENLVGATLVVTEVSAETPGALLDALMADLVLDLDQNGQPTDLTVVDLPLHGPAVRLVGLEEHEGADPSTALLSYVHHVALPVEETGVALLLTFVTLTVHLRSTLASLFDAVAEACSVEAAGS